MRAEILLRGVVGHADAAALADLLAATEYLDDLSRHGFDGVGGCVYLAVRSIGTQALAGIAQYASPHFGRQILAGLRDNGGPTQQLIRTPSLAICGRQRKRHDVEDAWKELPARGVLIVERPRRRDRETVRSDVPVLEGEGFLLTIKPSMGPPGFEPGTKGL